jgi:prepilin-type N-terminal cleavage/methylation domain-containing protein
MKRIQRGFTIVELLIVIVVIGILVGLTTTVWVRAGIGARDRARETETRAWAGAFDVYKGRFGVYPAMPTNDTTPAYVCLGSFSSTSGKCGIYGGSSSQYIDATQSPTTTMLANLVKVGNVPTNNAPPVGHQAAGPFVAVTQTTNAATGVISVTGSFIDFFELGCPTSDFTLLTSSSDPTISAIISALPGYKVCSLGKTFTYNPN